jgi:hypothetical protein
VVKGPLQQMYQLQYAQSRGSCRYSQTHESCRGGQGSPTADVSVTICLEYKRILQIFSNSRVMSGWSRVPYSRCISYNMLGVEDLADVLKIASHVGVDQGHLQRDQLQYAQCRGSCRCSQTLESCRGGSVTILLQKPNYKRSHLQVQIHVLSFQSSNQLQI